MSGDLQKWFNESPQGFRDWITSVPARNFVREAQNRAFQIPGSNDGSISAECRKLFEQEYEFLTELRRVLERMDSLAVAPSDFSGSNEVSRPYTAPNESKPILPPWEMDAEPLDESF